jgi:hypothetical protein
MKVSTLNPALLDRHNIVIKPIKPLVFDFFVSNYPKDIEPINEDGDTSRY